MATLYLHVGQAGCQIGQNFWAPLVAEITNSEMLSLALCHQHSRQQQQQHHRSIFVDTESKALHDAMRVVGAKRTGPCIRFGKSGRGSCFPMGFGEGLRRTDVDENFDFIRQESEKCDSLSAFVMTHSLGGGTGSGLGARIYGWIEDYFPLVNLLTVSCAGFARESPVQNYNTVLSLARLYRLCDAIILFNNEELVDAAGATAVDNSPSSPATSPTTSSTINDINREICFSLHGCFLPTASLSPGGGGDGGGRSDCVKMKSAGFPALSFNEEPLELIRTLASMPSHNVLQMDSVTQASDKPSSSLVQSLSRAVKRPWPIIEDSTTGTAGAASRERNKLTLMGMTVVTRHGADIDEDGVKKLTSTLPFASWNPFPVDVWRGDDSIVVPRLKKTKLCSLTACSNSNRFAPLLKRLVAKTRTLVSARAFVHWFEKHGCDSEDILEATRTIDTLVKNYDDL